MQRLESITTFQNLTWNIESKEIGRELCKCGQEVILREDVVPFGTLKGQTIVSRINCKCEDMELARLTLEHDKRLRNKRAQQTFSSKSIINPDLINATFDQYEPKNKTQRNALEICRQYALNFDEATNLVVYGAYGVGKSHLAMSIVNTIMENGRLCCFIHVPKLTTKIRSTFNGGRGNITEAELLDYIAGVDLLVLDDIGAETDTDWTMEKLNEITDSRQGRKTVYTSNLTPKQVQERYDARFFSRMFANMERKDIVKVEGIDHRTRKLRGVN